MGLQLKIKEDEVSSKKIRDSSAFKNRIGQRVQSPGSSMKLSLTTLSFQQSNPRVTDIQKSTSPKSQLNLQGSDKKRPEIKPLQFSKGITSAEQLGGLRKVNVLR
jgi:hypothetical protein